MSQPVSKVLVALGVVFLILLGMVGLWAMRAGGSAGLGQLLTTGRMSELQPCSSPHLFAPTTAAPTASTCSAPSPRP